MSASARVKQVFLEACAITDDTARRAFLDDACAGDVPLQAEVDALLRADALASGVIDRDLDVETAALDACSKTNHGVSMEPPAGYRIIEPIGSGGMGVVYRAEQVEPIRREVALKVIRPGMDSSVVLSRFEAERQTLALMNHPNVARVLDAGSTPSGQPYFAMELVRGLPITKHCEKHRVGIRARIELFIALCEGVQHAHAKGVIHRDLKPSNVLVAFAGDEPMPMVIDFGIAKALRESPGDVDAVTQHGQVLGTLEYMSPEQAESGARDVDIRTDVYALGVMLYELLTGTRPFETTSRADLLGAISAQDPQRPSERVTALTRSGKTTGITDSDERRRAYRLALRRDLDWVVMRCLEKQRERRYPTASALAEDLRRYLHNEPLEAGPPTTGYRFRKFVKRNRAGVITAGAVAFALLLGVIGTSVGLVYATSETRRAELAEQRVRERADELELIARFQTEQLEMIDPGAMGGTIRAGIQDRVLSSNTASADEFDAMMRGLDFTGVALETLDARFFGPSLEVIRSRFEDQPTIRARLLDSLASTMRTAGLTEDAVELVLEARDVLMDNSGPLDPLTLSLTRHLGLLRLTQDRFDDAEPLLQEAFDGFHSIYGLEHRDTLTARHNLGALAFDRDQLERAERLHRETLELRKSLLGMDDRSTLSSMNSLTRVLTERGKLDEAEVFAREVLATCQRVLGDDHRDTLRSTSTLGVLIARQRRLAEALPFYRAAYEGRRRVLGEDHNLTLESLTNLGGLLSRMERFDEAEPILRQALQSQRRLFGPDAVGSLSALNNLALMLRREGRREDALPLYYDSLERRQRVFGVEHRRTLVAKHNLAMLLASMGDEEEAVRLYDGTVEAFVRTLGAGHTRTILAAHFYGAMLGRLDRMKESVHYLRWVHDRPEIEERFSRSFREAVLQDLVKVHTRWHELEPDAGHDAQAADWQIRLDEHRATSKELGSDAD
ncbi:MAG: tetratricopeptide repeat protein [Planctomycetota bacterium]